MEERYIASVDLGTSKIAVCIARIQGQNVQVVYYKETPSQGIRNSYVLNPKKVEDVLRGAITEAQQEMRMKISQVIVGLPRYYVRQEVKSAKMEREDEDSPIMEQELRELKCEALKTYPLEDSKTDVIYGAVAQSFSTEDSFNELESDIVGMTAATLEGNFKVFVGNRRHSSNIDNIFRSMGISIAKKYFTPGITAKAVLKEEQMENGVALIDLGAGVSSVTIFEGKIMRYYAAIPFGGNSITNDIKAECSISFDLAENIKKGYGACVHDKLSSFGNKTLQINDENDNSGIQVGVKYISQIIDARMGEIIEALLYAIQSSGYAEKLRAGIVVTGGGVELVNAVNFIKNVSGCMVSIGSPRPFFTCEDNAGARSTGASTTMGMIYAAKGDRSLNCTSKPVPVVGKPLREKISEMQAVTPSSKPADEEQKFNPAAQAPVEAQVREAAPATEEPRQAPAAEERKPEKPSTPSWFELPNLEAVQVASLEAEENSIETTVAAAQNDEPSAQDFGGTVFEQSEGNSAKPQKKEGKRKKKITWVQHIQRGVQSLFDEMGEEQV